MVSLQFALHYFFKNIESLRGLIHNVVSNTRLNGYFIGTCFDGGTIFNRLEAKSKGEMISGTVGQSTLWKIKKNYEKETTPLGNLVARSRSFPASHKSLGKSIIVYMETINQYLEEYLVNFDYLTKLMNMNGFQVVGREEANKMGLPNGTGLFQEMFQQIPPPKKDESSFGNSREMSEVDKEFSFMNRWFVFKKVEEVSTIKLDVAVKKNAPKNAPKKSDPPPPPAKTQDPEPVKTPDADKSKPEVKKEED